MADVVTEQQNADEKLKDIFARLMDLYDRHAQERQLIIKEKEEVSKLVKQLVSQTKEIGQYENGIRKRIQDCIKESANAAISRIEQLVVEKANKANEEFINKIMQTYKSMESASHEFHAGKNKFLWKMMVVAVLSGVLSGLIMSWVLMPKPILPLTAEQISYLQDGQMLVQMWPKLTKQEKARLKAVSHEVAE